MAVTSFNNPKQLSKKCSKVSIDIADESTYGFLNANEIKTILQKKGLYPFEKDMDDISPRVIEEVLVKSPFVNTAECYKTQNGHVCISVTQRSPIVRIKGIQGDDYYIDENGGIMPNSKYTSDLIIVTGYVNRNFARRYISVMANYIMGSDLWRNQIEQINVQRDLGIELVPRVGNHIVFLGYLPMSQKQSIRQEEVTEFISGKLDRLEKFYRYGLSEAGWNKYQRIDLQYDNQIICKLHEDFLKPVIKEERIVHEADHPSIEAAAQNENNNTGGKPQAEPTVATNKKVAP